MHRGKIERIRAEVWLSSATIFDETGACQVKKLVPMIIRLKCRKTNKHKPTDIYGQSHSGTYWCSTASNDLPVFYPINGPFLHPERSVMSSLGDSPLTIICAIFVQQQPTEKVSCLCSYARERGTNHGPFSVQACCHSSTSGALPPQKGSRRCSFSPPVQRREVNGYL